MDRVDILGVKFDNVTMDEAINKAIDFIKGDRTHMIVTPNPEIVQLCVEKPDVMSVVDTASLVIADGVGIMYAAKMLKTPLKEKIPGFDFATNLLEHIEEGGYKLFLLGAAPGVADRAARNIILKHPKINICGTNDGYFSNEEQVIDKINECGADICYICLGAPKQEMFIRRNIDKTCAKVMIGLGGSMDVFAGSVKRAPDWVSKAGFEWLYRLFKDPKRIKRMMKIPVFLINVIKERH